MRCYGGVFVRVRCSVRVRRVVLHGQEAILRRLAAALGEWMRVIFRHHNCLPYECGVWSGRQCCPPSSRDLRRGIER